MSFTIEKIISKYKSYHPRPKEDRILKAYELAKLVYFGEKRLSGKDWIYHALGVAKIVADLKMDTTTICAALLHDAYKFGLTGDEVEKELGKDVRKILDHLEGLKKIKGKYKGEYSNEGYSEYLRRLILSSSTDIRALVIRLCEKYNSLKTIKELNPEIQKTAIDKALTIYAPLADQIGIYELKWRIEEAAFSNKDPEQYLFHKNIIKSHPYASKLKRDAFVESLSTLCKDAGIYYKNIHSRTKKPYSLYNKALRRYEKFRRMGISFDDSFNYVMDKVAFRIIVDTVEDCYKTLDLLHSKFKYLPEEFDDYIAKPKPNGYQSIQTAIEIEPGHYAEVQIRTLEMHEYNEWGPASHYFYKMSGGKPVKVNSERKIQMLKQLLSWKEQVLHDKAGVNIEDVEDYIFVFTPKGDIIELPKNSTPVDFAYKIHTGLGDTIGKVLVNKNLRPLNYTLKNGDVVEVYSDKNRKGPSRDWLDFVKSKEARLHIKKYLNKVLVGEGR